MKSHSANSIPFSFDYVDATIICTLTTRLYDFFEVSISSSVNFPFYLSVRIRFNFIYATRSSPSLRMWIVAKELQVY